MSMFHLVIPMAGGGTRFADKGFRLPKPLIPIHGKPFFYWSVMSVKKYASPEDITFIVLQNHQEEFGIGREIRRYFPDAEISVIPDVLPGAVFTCLEGVKGITDGLPVMFNDCDHMFKCTGAYAALNSGFEYDGGLITFESTLPDFSYVRYGNDGKVSGTIEKQAVSTSAICGAYIFGNGDIFRDAAEEYVNECPYSECFMSGVYNMMCRKDLRVAVFAAEWHVDFGTPERYFAAESSEHFTEASGDAV